MICNIQKDFVYVKIPKVFFNYQKLYKIIDDYINMNINIDLKKDTNDYLIEIIDINADKILKDIFIKYHNIPINFDYGSNFDFKNSKKPLVSCIILLNMNDFFVRDLTIPSIIFNSKDIPIEIIVVNNGETNFEYENIKVIKSDFYNIPKAYNKAASIAKGNYLAFFHDDCFLSDEDWINKCIYNLTDEVIAVGPEYHHFFDNEDFHFRRDTDLKEEFENTSGGFLKEVPLVMEKNIFFELGGFPEREIMGQEDIFLHKNILNKNKKNLKIDIKHYHFEGISTLLLFSNNNDLLKKLCGNFIFSKKETLDLMRYGIDPLITEKTEYCIKLYTENLNDPDFIKFCDNVSSFADVNDFGYLPEIYKNESTKIKKLLDGSIKVFTTVKDIRCLDILNNFVDFNKLLFNYIVNKSMERKY